MLLHYYIIHVYMKISNERLRIKSNIQISCLNTNEALGHKNKKEDDRKSRTWSECLLDTNRLKPIIYTIPSQVNSCIEDRIIYSFALMQQINRPSSKRHLHLSRSSRLFGQNYIFLLWNHPDQKHLMTNPVWSYIISWYLPASRSANP